VAVPEQAAGVLATAGALGAGPYLAVVFGLFVLGYVKLEQRSRSQRDEEHRIAVAQAYELLRDQAAKRVEEMREVMRCTRDGINSAVIEIEKSSARSYAAIRETNAEILRGIEGPLAKLERVIERNTGQLGRTERILDGMARPNGHG
jgi:hypothetical protein